jgi:hypothetical protein
MGRVQLGLVNGNVNVPFQGRGLGVKKIGAVLLV